VGKKVKYTCVHCIASYYKEELETLSCITAVWQGHAWQAVRKATQVAQALDLAWPALQY